MRNCSVCIQILLFKKCKMSFMKFLCKGHLQNKLLVQLTSILKTKLWTNNSCISGVPVSSITDGAPKSIAAYFHSSFVFITPISQSEAVFNALRNLRKWQKYTLLLHLNTGANTCVGLWLPQHLPYSPEWAPIGAWYSCTKKRGWALTQGNTVL